LIPTSDYAIWKRSGRPPGQDATTNDVRSSSISTGTRHATAPGYHHYVRLGFSNELTAVQLGHSDAKLIRDLRKHGQANAPEPADALVPPPISRSP
jgi:hypothetical protein